MTRCLLVGLTSGGIGIMNITRATPIDMPLLFTPGINLPAFFVSAAIGAVFGFVPARRTARLDPVEALSHA